MLRQSNQYQVTFISQNQRGERVDNTLARSISMTSLESVPNMVELNGHMSNSKNGNEMEVQLIPDFQSIEKDFGNKDADDDTSATSLGSSAEFSSSLGLTFSAIGFNSIEPCSPTKRRRSSIFLWEDDSLQGTRLVQKRLDTAAKTIARFFRNNHSSLCHVNQRMRSLRNKLDAAKKGKHDELTTINEWKLEAIESFQQELEGELQNLQMERKKTMKEMRSMKSELAVLGQETTTLRKECKLLEMSNKKLKFENKKLERESSTLRSKVSQLESENAELKSIQENYHHAAEKSDKGAHGMKKLGQIEKKKRKHLVKRIDSIVSLTKKECKSDSKLVEKVKKLRRRGERSIKAQQQDTRIS